MVGKPSKPGFGKKAKPNLLPEDSLPAAMERLLLETQETPQLIDDKPLRPKKRRVADVAPTQQQKIRDMSVGQKQTYDSGLPLMQEYGPGSADYIEFRDPRVQGPLINLQQLMPGATPQDIENIFRYPRNDPSGGTVNAPVHDYAQAPSSTMSDATMAPQPMPTATPSVQTKGNMTPPANDPLTMMFDSLMELFAGGVPSPGMGGGTTTAPMGGSPFTEMPNAVDMPQAPAMAPPAGGAMPQMDPTFAQLLQGPGADYPKTSLSPLEQEGAAYNMRPQGVEQMGQVGPSGIPPQPAARPAPAMKPPLPTANPNFHSAPGLEEIMQLMFGGGQQPMGQVPQRNPLFTGGV